MCCRVLGRSWILLTKSSEKSELRVCVAKLLAWSLMVRQMTMKKHEHCPKDICCSIETKL